MQGEHTYHLHQKQDVRKEMKSGGRLVSKVERKNLVDINARMKLSSKKEESSLMGGETMLASGEDSVLTTIKNPMMESIYRQTFDIIHKRAMKI